MTKKSDKKGSTAKSTKKSHTRETVNVINRMKCRWVVPRQLIIGETFQDVSDIRTRNVLISTKVTIISPNDMIELDKNAFDKYCKQSQAFQGMLDKGALEVAKKRNNRVYVEQELKTINEAKPPKHLLNENDTTTEISVGVGESAPHISRTKMDNLKAVNK